MPERTLTGSRIRERRISLGLRQADLARAVGISAAYLNLIEHNRRRIGGKLLNDIARELSVEANVLAEGAQVQVVAALRDAAVQAARDLPEVRDGPEMDRTEEFAGRYPGWARLVTAQADQIRALSETVAALTDRLTHDPFLSAAMHEVLSTVTAIRSAAGILAAPDPVDPEWQARFHRNIYEDSQRLADGAQQLTTYLEATSSGDATTGTPQDEVERWLTEQTAALTALSDAPNAPQQAALIERSGTLRTSSAKALARGWLARVAEDMEALPPQRLRAALDDMEGDWPDPVELAGRLGVGVPLVMRRLAAEFSGGDAPFQVGLVICDSSGTMIHRQPPEGFDAPRYGAACPLWPLYQALSRPMVPMRVPVVMPGTVPRRFLTYAIAHPVGEGGYDQVPRHESTMLILSQGGIWPSGLAPDLPVGTSCRICPRGDCTARREPSILVAGL